MIVSAPYRVNSYEEPKAPAPLAYSTYFFCCAFPILLAPETGLILATGDI